MRKTTIILVCLAMCLQTYAQRVTTLNSVPIKAEVEAIVGVKQDLLVSGTNIKTINSISLLGSGNLALSGTGDLLAANNLSDVLVPATARTNLGLAIGTHVQAYNANLTTYAGITPSANVQTLLGSADYAAFRTSLSLGNVTNESKATMFASPTFTGTPVVPSAITVGGNTITFPAVAATLLPNTTTTNARQIQFTNNSSGFEMHFAGTPTTNSYSETTDGWFINTNEQ